MNLESIIFNNHIVSKKINNRQASGTYNQTYYAQWNTAWTPQQENSVSEVQAYILE
jgi:hypothetical protein